MNRDLIQENLRLQAELLKAKEKVEMLWEWNDRLVIEVTEVEEALKETQEKLQQYERRDKTRRRCPNYEKIEETNEKRPKPNKKE